MRFIKSFLFLAIIAILGFSSLGVQAQSFSDNGKISQSTIERKVFKEILTLPYYGLFDSISYKVDGSTVTLFGKVRNAINKSDAEGYVKDIKGVTKVVNNIEVLPLSRFDDTIRYQLVREFSRTGGAFYRYLQGTNPSVRIIVDNGHVSLEGFVANRSDANVANILANGVSGVFSVENNLQIEKREGKRIN
jgi:hyperosmotically inducible protein